MIELNEELRQAVMQHPGEPVSLVDPATREMFVLVRSKIYQRLTRLVFDDSEFSVSEAYPLLDEMAAKAGWDDAAMDVYNDLAPKGPP
jgi:hypothetical protein